MQDKEQEHQEMPRPTPQISGDWTRFVVKKVAYFIGLTMAR